LVREQPVKAMKVFLAGVSCVGKTAIGMSLAGRLGCSFYDLDREIEKHFGESLGRLSSKTLTPYSFRKQFIAPVISKLMQSEREGSFVMALTPSSLMDNAYAALRGAGVVVALRDSPEDILGRITFYDEESRPICKTLTDEERAHYLKDIRKDIQYFGRSFRKADLVVDIGGLDIEESGALLERRLREWRVEAEAGA
jgi:shikimate kinase